MRARWHAAPGLLVLWTGAVLFAEPAPEEENLPAPQPLAVDVTLLSGGLRYRLANPNGQPAATESNAAAGFGLFVHARSGPESSFFFYEAQAALVSLPVAQQIRPDARNEAQTLLYLLPGDNLYGGLGLFTRRALQAQILLGRFRPDNFADALLGGHGSQTGLRFQIGHKRYGWLALEPLLFPALGGHFFQDRDEYRPVFVPPTEALERLRAAGDSDRTSYGHRLALKTGVDPLYLGVQYTLLRIESPPASPGERRKSPTHLELTSVGLGLQRLPGVWGARFFLGLEQSRGQYASALAGEEQRYRSSIHGAALRSGFAFLYGPFVFRLSFFLPEPPSPRHRRGQQATDEDGQRTAGERKIGLRGIR